MVSSHDRFESKYEKQYPPAISISSLMVLDSSSLDHTALIRIGGPIDIILILFQPFLKNCDFLDSLKDNDAVCDWLLYGNVISKDAG